MAGLTYRAVFPMVVGYRADGGQTSAFRGDPIVGLTGAEVNRLLAMGAIEKIPEPEPVESEAGAEPKPVVAPTSATRKR